MLTATGHRTVSYLPDPTKTDAIVSVEIPWRDPITAFAPFAGDAVAALLHSDGASDLGRWSFLAVSPFTVIKTDQHLNTSIDGADVSDGPFTVLRDTLSRYRVDGAECPAPFIGGAVGYLSYEMGQAVERLPRPKPGATDPAMVIGVYDVVAAFDHPTQRAWVIASGLPEQNNTRRLKRAGDRAAWLAKKIATSKDTPVPPFAGTWTTDSSPSEVKSRIAKAIDYIHAGDIFQANITQRFTAAVPRDATAWHLFRRMRQSAPSPFGAYVAGGPSFHLASSSPERFLKVDGGGHVETRPIKGSRPRGVTPEQDQTLANDLRSSPKDHAENLMIVDLMRNDLSRVCQTGSIAVPVQCGLETFTAIHHLVSVVTGQLRDDATAIDLLRACFPGGSVTGAPKVRAMEVIHELEPAARGPYCGTILWAGFDGAMDSSIVIRSLVVDGDTVVAQAGGGIVADSDPQQEFDEAMNKVRPLLSVLDPNRAV